MTHPPIAMRVIDLLSQKLLLAEEKIKDLSLGKIENRILHELVRFSKKNGRETKRLFVVTQKITHEELAGMVGTTRETVTKTLNELKRKRVIMVDLNRCYRVDKQKIVRYVVY
jgi:CRP/FNR family transcriptional regulator